MVWSQCCLADKDCVAPCSRIAEAQASPNAAAMSAADRLRAFRAAKGVGTSAGRAGNADLEVGPEPSRTQGHADAEVGAGSLRRQCFKRLASTSDEHAEGSSRAQRLKLAEAEASSATAACSSWRSQAGAEGTVTAPRLKRLGLSDSEQGPATLDESFRWAHHGLARLAKHVPAAQLRAAVSTLHWSFTTAFSGVGCAEFAAEFLSGAAKQFALRHGCKVPPGTLFHRACDSRNSCRRALLQRNFPKQCVFGKVEEWLVDVPSELPPRLLDAPELNFKESAFCYRHGQQCPLRSAAIPQGAIPVEVAGPPCPPWSRFGKRHGVTDHRFFPHQIWLSFVLQMAPWVVVFENVDTYDLWVLAENCDHKLWHLQACLLDPRDFGISMGRLRLYAVLLYKPRVMWNTSTPFHGLLSQLMASPVMGIADFFQYAHADPSASRALTSTEQRRLQVTS